MADNLLEVVTAMDQEWQKDNNRILMNNRLDWPSKVAIETKMEIRNFI